MKEYDPDCGMVSISLIDLDGSPCDKCKEGHYVAEQREYSEVMFCDKCGDMKGRFKEVQECI